MISENNYDRLIGDFLEVNGDIVNDEYKSKYPKFIAKFISKRNRRKLLKSVDKLRNSNYVLNCSNIKEYLAYASNNYGSNSFKDVHKIDYNEDMISSTMIFDKYIVLITIDNPDTNNIFNMVIKYDGCVIDASCRKLSSNKKEYENIYEYINSRLLNNICDYISYTINLFILVDKYKVKENSK